MCCISSSLAEHDSKSAHLFLYIVCLLAFKDYPLFSYHTYEKRTKKDISLAMQDFTSNVIHLAVVKV